MEVKFACLVVAAFCLQLCESCMHPLEFFGTLDSSLEISGSTLLSSASSCHCCGMCHQNTACKSFSFDTGANACTLYNKVGSYGEFSRESQEAHNTQFFIMPNISLTNEFCRSDSDCVTPGDVCRGQICTTATFITCREIFEQNNALPDHRYYGFISGQEIRLNCRMEDGFDGATMLMSFRYPPTQGVPWTAENRLSKTFYELENYPNEETDLSILEFADIIRESRTDAQYKVRIIAKAYGGLEEFMQTFTADRDLSLVGSERVMLSSGRFQAEPPVTYDDRYLTFPFLTTDCNAIYSTGNYVCNDRRSLMKTLGLPWWPTGTMARDSIVMYITQ